MGWRRPAKRSVFLWGSPSFPHTGPTAPSSCEPPTRPYTRPSTLGATGCPWRRERPAASFRMPRQRLDQALHARGLTESREQARRLIMAGEVRVDGQLVDRPSAPVDPDAQIEIKQRPRFVSRGGEKLEASLERFGLEAAGRICADLGASTGGFTPPLP